MWSSSLSDMNPIDSSLRFLLKSNARTPSDADIRNKKRFLPRNGHKRQILLAYFRYQICEQTRVCCICYRLSFENLFTYCTKQLNILIMLKIIFKFVSWCKSYFIFSVDAPCIYLNNGACEACIANKRRTSAF